MSAPQSDPRATIELYLENADTERDPFATIRPKTASIAEPTVMSPAEKADSEAEAKAALARLPRLTIAGMDYQDVVPVSPDGLRDLNIESVIGEGGMGVVYLAEQTSLNRKVAIKILRAGLKRPEQLTALLYEARLTGSLEHPGTIPVHAVGLDAVNRPVLVMKRIEGVGWDELLARPDHPAWERMRTPRADRAQANLEILMNVASTIAYAHSQGILHRDIKPANVMVGSFGEVYVADWGIALDRRDKRRRHKAGPLGTPSFMAPEMVFGEPELMDERTDVYLLGATLHLVLTQEPRHKGAGLKELFFAAAESEPIAYGPDVPKALADLANRATSRDIEHRPSNALEFRDAIAEHLRHRGAVALAARAQKSLDAAKKSAEGHVVRRHLIESRFGFQQSLAEWPEGPDAEVGLDNTLEATLELELRERSVGGARAALAEMTEPPPELVARVEALERELEEDARDRDAARSIRRQFDPAVARRKRTIFLIALAVGATGVTFGMRAARQDGDYPVPRTIVLPILVALALSPVAWWLKEDMSKSAVNRRFLAIVYAAFGLSATLRALAYVMQTNIVHMMVFELVVIAAAGIMLAISFHRAFAWLFVGAVACAFLAATHMDLVEFFYVPPIIGLVALSSLLQRDTRYSG